jgi:hypothetical protein
MKSTQRALIDLGRYTTQLVAAITEQISIGEMPDVIKRIAEDLLE